MCVCVFVCALQSSIHNHEILLSFKYGLSEYVPVTQVPLVFI